MARGYVLATSDYYACWWSYSLLSSQEIICQGSLRVYFILNLSFYSGHTNDHTWLDRTCRILLYRLFWFRLAWERNIEIEIWCVQLSWCSLGVTTGTFIWILESWLDILVDVDICFLLALVADFCSKEAVFLKICFYIAPVNTVTSSEH